MEKYTVITNKNYKLKYSKDIPFIAKNDFHEQYYKLVGETLLSSVKENKDYLGIISFGNNEYGVSSSYFGITKGYIQVGEQEFVILKTNKPVIAGCLIGIALAGMLVNGIIQINDKRLDVVKPVIDKIQETKPEDERIDLEKAEEEAVTPDTYSEEGTAPDYSKVRKITNKKENKVLYKIFFKSNGGKGSMSDLTVRENDKNLSLPKNAFTRLGYHFSGWSLFPNGTSSYDDGEDISDMSSKDNINLYALWTPDKFKISFYNGSSLYDTEIQEYGTSVIFPQDPRLNGYTFAGWDNEEKKVTKDASYKALYDTVTYNISYVLNDGTVEDLPKTYTVETKGLSIPNPTRVGYTFAGWSVNGSKELYKDLTFLKGSYGNKVLTAHFTQNQYLIHFNTDGGKAIDDKEVIYGSAIGSLEESSKPGYSFVGWKNDKGEYVNADNIYNITSDSTLTAVWTPRTYKITFVSDDKEVSYKSVVFNTPYGILSLPTKDGYKFMGWYLGDKLVDKDTVFSNSNDVVLTAKWQKLEYTFNYDEKTNLLTINVNEGNNDDIKLPEQLKNGYTFTGWTSVDDKSVTTPNKAITIKAGKSGIFTYKANWKATEYKLSYNLNGGRVSTNNKESYTIESNDFTLVNPTKDNYDFIGWTDEDISVPQMNLTIKKGTTGNKTLVANYVPTNYTISYNLDGGSFDSNITPPKSYNIESSDLTLPYPTKRGYTFAGWTGNGIITPTKSVVIKSGSKGNVSYTARYTKNKYKVNYFVNGSLWKTEEVLYEASVPNLDPSEVLDEDLKLVSWTGMVDKMPDYDINLYANLDLK